MQRDHRWIIFLARGRGRGRHQDLVALPQAHLERQRIGVAQAVKFANHPAVKSQHAIGSRCPDLSMSPPQRLDGPGAGRIRRGCPDLNLVEPFCPRPFTLRLHLNQ